MNPDWRSRYEIGIDLTRRAARVAMGYFDGAFTVEWKGDQSPVTVADREAEQFLRTELRQAFPGDGFLGEEFADEASTSGYRWIIDPIDGTRAFVRGVPLWGTLVGLEYKGELIAGIADAAPLGQTFHALRGEGAWRNERRIRVSDEADLKQSIMYYSSLSWFLKAGREKQFLKLVGETDRQRGYGDFYAFMLVAQGSGELCVEHGVHAWDIAALRPIVEEAGGKFTTWSGGWDLNAPDVVASNGKVHQAALAVLNGEG